MPMRSFRSTDKADQQLDELSAAGFGNATQIILVAIDRMHAKEIGTMNAREQIETLLKIIYDPADVNAMQIWKGYDAGTGENGWHYKNFGRSDAQYLGKSVAEVREYIDEASATFRAQYVEAKAAGIEE